MDAQEMSPDIMICISNVTLAAVRPVVEIVKHALAIMGGVARRFPERRRRVWGARGRWPREQR